MALLNNPGLQSKYAELGIAQADLIQAGLLSNPLFGALVSFPAGGGSVNLDFNLVFNFLNIFTIPLRKVVAESEFEEAQLKMVKFTLDLASQTRSAYYQAQATLQIEEMFDQVVKSADASFTAAKALRDAGNTSALQLDLEQSFYEQSKVDLLAVESTAYQARQKLIRLLGLQSDGDTLQLHKHLPKISKENLISEDVVELALKSSLDLKLIRQRLETLAQKYHVTNVTALIPEFNMGALAEREEGHWEFGPSVEFVLPIFDQGQPAIAKAQFEIRGMQEAYANTVIQVHSAAKALKKRLLNEKQRVHSLKKAILPLHQKILAETLLHYNAMQVGVFDLIKAKQRQIEAGRKYIEAQLEYWIARSSMEQLIQGSLPPEPDQISFLMDENSNGMRNEGRH